MVLNSKLLILFYLGVTCFDQCYFYCQSTLKNSGILTRNRRYLAFPKGANLVYSMVYVKALMKKVPKGCQFFHEFDVPHPLPPDISIFRQLKHRHRVHRRQLFNDIVSSLDRYGLNGTACVTRIVCEAKQFVPFKGKSLVKDMLLEIFLGHDGSEVNGNIFEQPCDDFVLEQCPHPLLDLMWGSFTNY